MENDDGAGQKPATRPRQSRANCQHTLLLIRVAGGWGSSGRTLAYIASATGGQLFVHLSQSGEKGWVCGMWSVRVTPATTGCERGTKEPRRPTIYS